MPPLVALMVCGSVPRTESYFSRCAIVVERAEVVDRHEVDVDAALLGGAEEVAADATEAVDAHANRHVDTSLSVLARCDRPAADAAEHSARHVTGSDAGAQCCRSRWVTRG